MHTGPDWKHIVHKLFLCLFMLDSVEFGRRRIFFRQTFVSSALVCTFSVKTIFSWIAYLIGLAIFVIFWQFLHFLSILKQYLSLLAGIKEENAAFSDTPLYAKHGSNRFFSILEHKFSDFLINMVSGWTSVHLVSKSEIISAFSSYVIQPSYKNLM